MLFVYISYVARRAVDDELACDESEAGYSSAPYTALPSSAPQPRDLEAATHAQAQTPGCHRAVANQTLMAENPFRVSSPANSVHSADADARPGDGWRMYRDDSGMPLDRWRR